MPTVFMDSHFYDYRPMAEPVRHTAMRHWMQECHSVGGDAVVLWHPHTLTQDYGWTNGFLDALGLIREFDTCQ